MNLLVDAYLRRKRWEFRAQAAAVINALGESMGNAPQGSSYNHGYRQIDTGAMFSRIGI